VLAAFALTNFGQYIGQTVFYFFVARVLRIESAFGPALLLSALCGAASAPFWILLAKRVEIHRLIAGSIIAAILVRTIGYWLITPGHAGMFLAIDATASALGAATLVLSPSLLAAAIDYGTFKTGRDRAGTYIAISTVVMQSTAALTFLFVFPLLGLAGFNPSAKADSAQALDAVKAMAILAPVPFAVLSALIVARFPIPRRKIAALTARLARSRGGDEEIVAA